MVNYKNVLQSCHLNFLIGSGISSPYLSTLKNIEKLLTAVDEINEKTTKKKVRASIFNKYFQACITKNTEIIDNFSKLHEISVASNYISFFRIINSLVLKRKNNLINKQINLFTTNIDVFQESALEKLSYEVNDGFSGYINPRFDLSNFKKTVSKISPHYSVVSEIPVFNIFKLHGSVTWKINNGNIIYNDDLDTIREIQMNSLSPELIISPGKIKSNAKADDLSELAKTLKVSPKVDRFIRSYEKLSIINPTKDKFKSTTLNYTYYELLRMFSSELERENSVLFVMGFSFADEHIREIVKRCAKSNPTLLILIFAYDSFAEKEISINLTDTELPNNIHFISRGTLLDDSGISSEVEFDLRQITAFFNQIYSGLKAEV